MNLKKYWKGRKKKWGSRWYLFTDIKKNQKANWIVLIAETIVVIYLVLGLMGCPCALRTCGIKSYQMDGKTIKWEAENLDCDYVQSYLDGEVGRSDLVSSELKDLKNLEAEKYLDRGQVKLIVKNGNTTE